MHEPFPADKEYLKETFEYDSDSDLGDEIDEDVERSSASTSRDEKPVSLFLSLLIPRHYADPRDWHGFTKSRHAARDIAIEESEGENPNNLRGKKHGRIIVLSMGAHKTFVHHLHFVIDV